MFENKRNVATTVSDNAYWMKQAVADAADAVTDYVDPLAHDEKLRKRLAAAIGAAAAARDRARRQAGTTGLARRLGSDRVLRAQLAEVTAQLKAAQRRAKKARSHKVRNTLLFLGGVGLAIAAVPAARQAVTSAIRRRGGQSARSDWSEPSTPKTVVLDEEIDVAVPVSTAYNQWTQFEEFPRFMEAIDEVRQLDDTLLHWAATVAGKHAEWEAKIIEQEPDRRITWESTDGKRTRGTVSFEEAGPGRSRVRLHMSYAVEGVAEKVGSAVGLDSRRVRGDLQRFREPIEARQVETGAWRGEIKDGVETRRSTTS